MSQTTEQHFELRIDTLAEQLETACILEAAARKPGNVHPQANFEDLCFVDFVKAAGVAGQILGQIESLGLGRAILTTIQETRRLTGSNVNLGITLLLAPLAAVRSDMSLKMGISNVLSAIDLDDTELVYAAIRSAQAGGMGEVAEADIAQTPIRPLVDCMELAAHRDAIARQYCQNFEDVLDLGRNVFLGWIEGGHNWEASIIGTQLELMKQIPDSLIARKCGDDVARDAAMWAASVLAAGWPDTQPGHAALEKFDHWLRANGHSRNPGTTADLIAAVLFSVIRDRQWTPPREIWVHTESSP